MKQITGILISAALLLTISSPALPAPPLHQSHNHTPAGPELLRRMQFQTDILNQYFLKHVSRAVLIQRLINGKVIVIGSTPNPDGRLFNVQDYILHGHSYIPVFSDIPTAQRLFGRARKKPGMTFWIVGGRVFLGLFQKNEWVIVNEGAANRVEFHANEFRPYLRSRHTNLFVIPPNRAFYSAKSYTPDCEKRDVYEDFPQTYFSHRKRSWGVCITADSGN